MSKREVIEPTPDAHGGETHPAWGMIGASRVSTGPTGTTLFDSEILHQHTVVVRLGTASRKRHLSRDWLHRDSEFVEVEMSEAQWASFVSSMNTGNGVPCTIRSREDDRQVPGFPYAPRMAASMAEVREVATRSIDQVCAAFEAYEQHKTVANLRTLKYVIENAPANMTFAAKSLSEHAENVVQKARADVEAMAAAQARHLGLPEPGEQRLLPE